MAQGRGQIFLGAVALAAIAVAAPAFAGSEPRREYHLEEQDLGSALRAIGRSSGREVIFESKIVDGKHAPRIEGSFTATEAIDLLLRESGLVAIYRNGAILIVGRSDPSDPEVAGSTGSDDIVVTGTHIRGATPTAPLIGRTRQQIEARGLTDLGSFARSIPQNFAGGQNPGVISSVQDGSENFNSSSTLNLRGIGSDATLTLINGHRVAYDSVVQGVDISAIPLVAVERVEIVADGSSALYGSDAVGGVANVILRRDYDGLLTNARIGAATSGGSGQQQYSAVAGETWTNGGFMVAGDYSKSTAVTAGQRSVTDRLDNSVTLYPSINQMSAVVTGHQQLLPNVEFDLDAQFSHRKSFAGLAFFTTADFRTSGTYGDRSVTAYSIAPRLRLRLPANWEASLRGTYGVSDSDALAVTALFGRELGRNRVSYDNGLDAIELDAEGPLATIPGGDIRLAVGGGYRSFRLNANIVSATGGTVRTLVDYRVTQHVAFGYGELSFPLVGATNRSPLLYGLRATAALRFEDYQRIGGTATPKFGIVFEPNSEIAFKASWGRSFKAPTLAQANQHLDGALLTADSFTPEAPGGRPVLLLSGAIPGLKPERATTWTTTFSYVPKRLDGLRLELSFFDTHYRDRVVEPLGAGDGAFTSDIYRDFITLNPSAQQVQNIVVGLPLGLTNQTGGEFDPASVGAIIDNRLQNVARQNLKGVDASISYDASVTSSDQLHLQGSASYLESSRQLSPGQPVLQQAGTIFDPPHWRGNATFTWERAFLSLTGVVNYIGGNRDDRTTPNTRVGSFTSLDGVATLKSSAASGVLRGAIVTFAVSNILNKRPSIVRSSGANPTYDATNYPVVGRVINLTLSKAW